MVSMTMSLSTQRLELPFTVSHDVVRCLELPLSLIVLRVVRPSELPVTARFFGSRATQRLELPSIVFRVVVRCPELLLSHTVLRVVVECSPSYSWSLSANVVRSFALRERKAKRAEGTTI